MESPSRSGRGCCAGKVHEDTLEYLEGVARAREIESREALEDQVAPTFGLESGRVLSYGARRFHVVLDEDLYPLVRDEQGRDHRQPPEAAPGEDPAAIERAWRDWLLLREGLHLSPGLPAGSRAHDQPQRITALTFTKGWPKGARVAPVEVEPVCYSEAMRDLHRMAAAAHQV